MREWMIGRFGSKANRWKAEGASYAAKHMWLIKHNGKASMCQQVGCEYPKLVNKGRTLLEKPSRYEWANVSGEYKRDISDWVQLCPSCHRKIDMGKIQLCVQ